MLFAAYKIYFKNLFFNVKESLEEEKKYIKNIECEYGSEKSNISAKNKLYYKNKMESSSYRCSITSEESNNGFFPALNNCETISEQIFFQKKHSSIKNLVDAKIARSFYIDKSNFYYRYDDGKLIISNNTTLYDTVNKVKNV